MSASPSPYLVAVSDERRPAPKRTRALTRLLLFTGVFGLAFYGYSIVNQTVYQNYENWAFDQQVAGRTDTAFSDYVRYKLPFSTPAPPPAKPTSAPLVSCPQIGDILGRVEVPRLGLSAIVREGVDSHTLSSSVGHVPSTSLAGQQGNFAIAAHRDTLFRGLKDIHEGDLVTFQSGKRTFTYRVFHTTIVKPSEVSVLRPDGGLIQSVSNTPRPMLTMITCYPFYYVGNAPKRFIVQARLVSAQPDPGRKS